MKNKYQVQTNFVFYGYFTVEAENEEQARQLVNNQCGLVLGGNIHTTLNDKECDWVFNHHPDKVIGIVKRAKNTTAEKSVGKPRRI